MRSFLLVFLAVLLSLPSCAQSGRKTKVKAKKATKTTAASKTTNAAKPAVESKPVLTFQRTACFGTCPAYSAQVFADGRVVYDGQLHVPVTGQKEFKLPAAKLDEMLRTARAVDFANLQEQYSRGTTDIPSTLIGLQLPSGNLKTVTVDEGAPLEVNNLIAYLRTIFDELAGISAER